MKEHYFVSDMGSYGDVNKTDSWAEVGGHQARRILPFEKGQLYTLAGDRFLYFTQKKGEAVKLSTLIADLNKNFGSDGDFEIHWTACRSVIGGQTMENKLAQMNNDNISGISKIR